MLSEKTKAFLIVGTAILNAVLIINLKLEIGTLSLELARYQNEMATQYNAQLKREQELMNIVVANSKDITKNLKYINDVKAKIIGLDESKE